MSWLRILHCFYFHLLNRLDLFKIFTGLLVEGSAPLYSLDLFFPDGFQIIVLTTCGGGRGGEEAPLPLTEFRTVVSHPRLWSLFCGARAIEGSRFLLARRILSRSKMIFCWIDAPLGSTNSMLSLGSFFMSTITWTLGPSSDCLLIVFWSTATGVPTEDSIFSTTDFVHSVRGRSGMRIQRGTWSLTLSSSLKSIGVGSRINGIPKTEYGPLTCTESRSA